MVPLRILFLKKEALRFGDLKRDPSLENYPHCFVAKVL